MSVMNVEIAPTNNKHVAQGSVLGHQQTAHNEVNPTQTPFDTQTGIHRAQG